MDSEEAFGNPGQDEAVLVWAQNYERTAYESLVQQIGEVSIDLHELIINCRDSSPESYAKLGKFCRLLSRQSQFISGPKITDFFKN